MGEELRAMTLSLAIEYAKATSADLSVEDVITAAKKFQAHINHGGIL